MQTYGNPYGIETKYTFFQDFQIAWNISGLRGVEDTYKRVMREWGSEVRAYAEIGMGLNWLLWLVAEKTGDTPDARALENMWIKHHDGVGKVFKDKEQLSEYYQIVD